MQKINQSYKNWNRYTTTHRQHTIDIQKVYNINKTRVTFEVT